jgi:hypothetical protein
MTTTTKPELSEWTSRTGQVRRYINNWPAIVGLDVGYYKTGNIQSASLNGERISNAEAGRLLSAKVWIDAADEIHVDYNRSRTSDDDIKAAVRTAMGA